MIITEFTTGGHRWAKTNLITQEESRPYDCYRCEACGIFGKSYNFGQIHIPERYRAKLYRCAGVTLAKRVKVIHCHAVGPQFGNLTPGSCHDIVPTPHGENDKNGVWVRGIGEPVKLLFGEFEYLSNE